MITAAQAKQMFGPNFFSFEEYLTGKTEYQEVGEQLLLEQKHAFLYYDPGKGKTYPTVAALRDVWKTFRGNIKVLILSTKDAVDKMWNYEIVPQEVLPDNVVILNFESAIQDKRAMQLKSIKWDVIIVDESHKIKSHNSKTSKLVFQLTKKAEYAWGLTGTPRGNSELDIFNQFHNMNVSDWGLVSYSRFIATCCDVETGYGRGHQFRKILGINHKYLAGWERNMSMYTQRVTYDEKDEMPPLNFNPVILPYTKSEHYLQAEKGCMVIDDYETTMVKLAAISKMHQAVNGFLYYTPDNSDKRETVVFERNAKLDWLIQNLPNEPVTIVYRHEADLKALQETFPNSTENINDFKAGKYPILFLQCARCESFNLQMCRNIIFYTLDYSYIKFKQMMHRVWRKGQESDTNVTILLFAGSVEIDIWKAVENKKRLADIFMSVKRG